MNNPLSIMLGQLTEKKCSPRKTTSGWSARCPAHADENPSLSVSTGEEGRVLVKCHAGCELGQVLASLGLAPADLFSKRLPSGGDVIESKYNYVDEDGCLLYQVVRRSPKGFFCRRPDGTGGWVQNLQGVPRVVYRLPDLRERLGACPPESRLTFVAEGEKDVDRLHELGLAATTNPGGAGKWSAEFTKQLQAAGAEAVAILPDNDDPGDRHAREVAASCLQAGLTTRIVTLPWVPPLESRRGQDVSDWLDRGNTTEQLLRLVDESPRFVPSELAGGALPRSTFALTPIGTLLAEPVEEADWLAEGLLPAGGLSVLAGKPKAGKSTEARILARCVAHGEPWLGRPTKRGAVFYLALEEKRSQVRAHFERMETKDDDPIFVFVSALPEDGLAQLVTAAQERKPALIIVDTFIRATRLKDINDYASVSLALEPFLTLARETGAHVLFVHHMGKGERIGPDGILGSTAIYATVDTALLLVRTDRYRTIRSIQRYGEDLPETVLQLDPATGFTSLAGTREDADKAFLGEAVVAELRGRASPAREDDLLAVVEGRKKVKERALRTAVEGGRIKRTGKGVKGDPYLYSISGMLPPSSSEEGESSNTPEGARTGGDGMDSPSREVPQGDSPSRNGDRVYDPLDGPWERVYPRSDAND